MISSSTLEAMAAAGCTVEQIISVVKAHEVELEACKEKRREDARNRQRKHRERVLSRNVTHVTRDNCDTPSPPSFPLIPPPTTPPIIPQSSTQSPAATAGLDFGELEKRLVDAVGEENIQGYSVKALGPILGMIQAGADVETDILPTIRSVAKNLKKPVRSWSYFVPAITDALNSRVKAGRGVVKPVETTFDESNERWEKRLSLARASEVWHSAVWGPKPGENGCKVPNSLLTETDGLGWRMVG